MPLTLSLCMALYMCSLFGFVYNGLTPIHLASIIKSKEPLVAITKVVGGGEVLDLPDGQTFAPHMYTYSYGNEENVKFLIKKKVSGCIIRNPSGHLVYHCHNDSYTTNILSSHCL